MDIILPAKSCLWICKCEPTGNLADGALDTFLTCVTYKFVDSNKEHFS